MEGRGGRSASKKEKARGTLAELSAQRFGQKLEQLPVEEDAVYETYSEQQYAELVSERRRNASGFVVPADEDKQSERALSADNAYVDTGEEADWSSFAPSEPSSATLSTPAFSTAQPSSAQPLKRKRSTAPEGHQSGSIRALLAKRHEHHSKPAASTKPAHHASDKPSNAPHAIKQQQQKQPEHHAQQNHHQQPQQEGFDDLLNNICGSIAEGEDVTPVKPRKLCFADEYTYQQPTPTVTPPVWAAYEEQHEGRRQQVLPSVPSLDSNLHNSRMMDIDNNETNATLNASSVQQEVEEKSSGEPEAAVEATHARLDFLSERGHATEPGKVQRAGAKAPTNAEHEPDIASTAAIGGGLHKSTTQEAQNEEDNDDDAGIDAAHIAQEGDKQLFYFLDAQEQSDRVFIFGRIPDGEAASQSACAVVSNVPQVTYAVPHPHVFEDVDGSLAEWEREVGTEDPRIRKELHKWADDMKAELKTHLESNGIAAECRKIVPVKRSYYLQRNDVTRGEQWMLQVRYWGNAKSLQVPDMSGDHVAAIVGGTSSCVETLVLERRMHGPSWLSITNATPRSAQQRASWCKHEFELNSMDCIENVKESEAPAPPKLSVVGIAVKPLTPKKESGGDELSAVTLLRSPSIRADAPMQRWSHGMQQITALRKHPSQAWPARWEELARQNNGSDEHGNSWMICPQHSEHSLLAFILDRIAKMDPDILVGHGLGQDLHLLLYRASQTKAPRWSRFGRLSKDRMPKLSTGGGSAGGVSFGVQNAFAGRLLADTLLASKELLHEESYDLTSLVKKRFGMERHEIKAEHVAQHYDDKQLLLGLARANEADAFLSMKLLFDLAALQLSKQLASLSGCLWSSALLGQRSQRVEYLLLHEFYRRGLVCPVRPAKNESKSGKRGQPAYTGGLVLEPKPGLYNRYVVVLDFKSLYPSLICEYNICFTTVEFTTEGKAPSLPVPPADDSSAAIVPSAIKRLVDGRNRVKKVMKEENEGSSQYKKLEVREKALKLLANSVYGCLGFEGNRFHARSLAELITAQGREVLQGAVDAANAQGMDVVYGDTDSIMVSTSADTIEHAVKEADKVKSQINKRYRSLIIEKENVFKVLLLLKKKKYVGMKVVGDFREGEYKTIEERKGVDIVRRDWSELAKEAGRKALSEILCGQPLDSAVEAIHDMLRWTRQGIENKTFPINKFEIRKQLVRRLDSYSSSSTDPHVVVARRRALQGYHDSVNEGEVVPYIVCSSNAEGAEAAPMHQRAFHPEELNQFDRKLEPDPAYYLEAQIHALVKRLCEPLPGTDARRLADCLGLDPSRFKASAVDAADDDEGNADEGAAGARQTMRANASSAVSIFESDNTYAECEPLVLKARDGSHFSFEGIRAFACGRVTTVQKLLGESDDGSRQPLSPQMLANQVQAAVNNAIASFYSAPLRVGGETDAVTSATTTRSVSVAALDPATGSDKPMRWAHHSAWALFLQLMHYKRLLDPRACSEEERQKASAAEAAVAPALEVVDTFLKRSAFRIVSNLGSWCG